MHRRVKAAAQHSSSKLGSAFALHFTCIVTQISQIAQIFIVPQKRWSSENRVKLSLNYVESRQRKDISKEKK